MKKSIGLFASLLAACMLLISCASSYYTSSRFSANKIGDNAGYFSVKVFQTLDENNALCLEVVQNNTPQSFKVVTYENILFDGQVLSNNWVLIDTYTYFAKDSTWRTVPVIMAQSEYKKTIK